MRDKPAGATIVVRMMNQKKRESHFTKPDWLENFLFSPIIKLPSHYYIHDFRNGPDELPPSYQYSIGRYNEVRKNMYNQDIFQNENRNIHIGIDIAAPIGEKIHSFFDGEIFLLKNNSQKGDYGPTIITKHTFSAHVLFALHGHLSLDSLHGKSNGQKIKTGEIIGSVGDQSINGGWFPHLHFQISLQEPTECDMPGVVSEEQLPEALLTYPDPRWILGPIYE